LLCYVLGVTWTVGGLLDEMVFELSHHLMGRLGPEVEAGTYRI
jgi:hypothetical protein